MSNIQYRLAQAVGALVFLPLNFMLINWIIGEGFHITRFEVGGTVGIVIMRLLDALDAWKQLYGTKVKQ